MTFVIVAACIAGYLWFSRKLTKKLLTTKEFDASDLVDCFFAAFFGLMWPIVIPFWLVGHGLYHDSSD